jgi:hypothetical protein
MPKNIKGGKGAKKAKNKQGDVVEKINNGPAPIHNIEEGLEYAKINKKLGNGYYANLETQGREVFVFKRGAFNSRRFRATQLRFEVGSIILVAHRQWDNKWKNGLYKADDPTQKREQVDLVHLYSSSQINELKRKQELPEWMYVMNDDEKNEVDDGGFVFGETEEGNNKIETEIDIDDI